MAGLKITLLFMFLAFYTLVDAGVTIFPSSSYLPVPSPSPDTAVPSWPPTPGPFPSAPFPSPPMPEPSPLPAPISSPPMPAQIPPSWAIKAAYWPSFSGFPASSIDTSYFNHIYYAFLLPDPVTYKLVITSNDAVQLLKFASVLRAPNPPVKTLLSIGGAGNDPLVFSKMASSNSTRAIFIDSTIDVARKYGFDGVDLDWEFPTNQEDMSNLGLLFKEWRKELVNEAMATGRPRLLLTAAVYFASNFFLSSEPISYPGESIRKNVDWVSPLCFDYHGSWENVTGDQSAMYDPNSNITTSFGIQSWINAGVPAKKVVMGLPLYGRTWRLKDPNVNGIGAPAVGAGPGAGILIYSDVVDFNNQNNVTVNYDILTGSLYSYAGDSWIGYDDVMTIKMKIQFARSRGLGGYFFWALGQDKDWTISREASRAW